MVWEIVKRKDSLYGANKPYISISTNRFGFNALFSKLAGLDETKKVTINIDNENRKIGFEFHADDRINSRALYYQSGSTKGTKGRSMSCSAVEVIRQYDWVQSVAKLQSRKNRRFKPSKHGKLWVIQLRPAFEIRKARESKEIQPEIVGIYQYKRENGEIVYIGQGEIKQRLNTPERKDWDFAVIEYSIVEDPDERLKWEDFWLERFRESNNNKLPIYNRISGKNPRS